jgi:outer membrane lipoprotein-sorting protein
MKKRLAMLAAAAALFSLPAAGQTVDDIIAKSAAARGGLDKIKAVQSVRMTGRVEIGPGMEAPFTLELKRPNHMRLEFIAQGMTGIQAYDGKSGWQVMPFNGSSNAEPMSPEDLKDAQEQADFDGPLLDYKAKGNQVELAGKEDVEGTPTYKLKITLKNGDVQYQYIDADAYLELKELSKRMIQGTERQVETTVGNYKEVQGLMFPFAIESGIQGGEHKQKIIVDKVELNVPVDDARFAMPAPKPAETKPGGAKPPAAPAH